MPILPSLIGAGAGLLGSLYGGWKAAGVRKRMDSYLNQQNSENQAWYNANALSDYTQRADAQNLLKNLRENLSRQNKIAAGTAVITGSTDEQQAAAKERSNKMVSDLYGNLGAMGQQWMDNITDQYLKRNGMIANPRMGMMEGAANSYENLMSTGLDMTSGYLGNTLDAWSNKINQKGALDTEQKNKSIN
jgi:hypothetical protein